MSDQDLVLAATMHDPGDLMAAMVADQVANLSRLYRSIVVCVSPETAQSSLDRLSELGAIAYRDEPGGGIPSIGVIRRSLLRRTIDLLSPSVVHLIDFDAALHWSRFWPEELASLWRLTTEYDFVALGRTARAQSTLPSPQRETERLANVAFESAWNGSGDWRVSADLWPPDDGRIDVCSGAWALTRRAVEVILARSRVDGVGQHAEWPLMMRQQASARMAYAACEGMEYETLDRLGGEVERAGGIESWRARHEANPTNWAFRLSIATDIARTSAELTSAEDRADRWIEADQGGERG